MTRYAALLAVLMVGIAVGQKPAKKDQSSGDYFTLPPKIAGMCAQGPVTWPVAADGYCYLTDKNKVIKALEPQDVPAIQERRQTKCVPALLWPGPACSSFEWESVTTCAEKSRILEHDEQTPPKFWCRKVQP